MRVLLVEGDKWFAESLANTLTNLGNFEVKCSSSASGAILAIDEFQPDLILLDLVLANVNGLTLLQELQSYNDTRVIPVIILASMTARLKHEDLAKFNVQRVLDKSVVTPEKIVKTCLSVRGIYV